MQENWLIFTYKVPSEPSRKRAYVWRQLKQLGAVYLQQAICVLPERADVADALAQLGIRVAEMDGESTVFQTSAPNPAWLERVVAASRDARDEEYAEVVENIERMEAELARETAAGKFTFAELEELDSDIERLRRWLARVQARDYFHGTREAEAVDRLEAATRSLEAFTTTVYEREGGRLADGPR